MEFQISPSCRKQYKKAFHRASKSSLFTKYIDKNLLEQQRSRTNFGGYGVRQFKFFQTRLCCLAPISNLRHSVKLNYFKAPKHVTLEL